MGEGIAFGLVCIYYVGLSAAVSQNLHIQFPSNFNTRLPKYANKSGNIKNYPIQNRDPNLMTSILYFAFLQ